VAEIDPVILDIRAEMGRYKAELRSSTALAQASFQRQEQSIQRLERQIRASSGNIAGTLRGLSGAFAGAFSAQQVSSLIDSYTRFNNSLRVTGLEGERLSATQEKLFAVAQKYGVELEALGNLYAGAAQSQRDLGASQEQILVLTEQTAQALKITGTSTAQASGAILGLSQALASGTVRAEEFNQINEGGLRPLLQVVANTDKYGGSIAKLRVAVAAGKVSSKEFFDALQSGSAQLSGQASKAALTLEGAFNKLTNALSQYIGKSAESNGVTGAIAAGLELLAKNLDTVADALAVVGAVLLGRFAAGMVAGTASTALASTALFAFQARAVGAASTLEALGLVAATTGRTLLAALGGPVGLAVTALALAFGYLATQETEAARAANISARAQQIAGDTTRKASDAVDALASAHGKAREEALKAAKAEYENTKQKLASVQASILLAKTEARKARDQTIADAGSSDSRSANFGLGSNGKSASDNSKRVRDADAELAAQEQAYGTLYASYLRLYSAIRAPESPVVPTTPTDKKKKGRKGRDPADIEREFQEKLGQLYEEQLRAQLDITTDAEKRAELQGALYEIEYRNRISEINAAKDLSQAQKAKLRAATNAIYGRDANGDLTSASPQGIGINRELEAKLRDLQIAALSDQQETLRQEADLVDTRTERLAIERRILDAAQEEERQRLEAAIAAGDIKDAEEARANLARRQSLQNAALGRQFESPLQQYQREIYGDINDRVQDIEVDGLRKLGDALTTSTKNALGLRGALGDIAGELIRIGIERQIIGPLANTLFGAASGGGGGAIGSLIGKLFGRASGGYVAPGSLTRVNEGRGGVELLRMGPQGGQVIPLGQTRAAASGGTVVKNYNISVSADNSVTPAGFASGLAQSILAEAKRMDARTAQATLSATPGVLRRAERYGG
jgi:tape measure domain-containing protein